MASTCSFRITRTTEDLAQTITALSQRLIKLEQRFEAIELQLSQTQTDIPVREIAMLDGIDQQLKQCKELLQVSSEENESEQIGSVEASSEENESEQIELVEASSEENQSEEMWIEEEKQDNLAA